MKTVFAVLALSLFACSTEVQTPTSPEAVREPDPSAPVTSTTPPPEVDAPPPNVAQDFPASCVSPRFASSAGDEGPTITDSTTSLTWLATDVPFVEDHFPSPDAACGFDGGGYRAATTAEVLALAAAIPGCSLPGLFHAVYAWAPDATGALPIMTSDGCVDVRAGVSYAGDCSLASSPYARDTLCVK
jgi:hypothetical protein